MIYLFFLLFFCFSIMNAMEPNSKVSLQAVIKKHESQESLTESEATLFINFLNTQLESGKASFHPESTCASIEIEAKRYKKSKKKTCLMQ